MTQQDDQATEEQIAAALAPILAELAAQGAPVAPSAIETPIDEAVGAMLLAYLLRVGFEMIRSFRQPEPPWAERIDELAYRYSNQGVRRAAEWTREAVHHWPDLAPGTEMADRVDRAANSVDPIAVGVTTASREMVRRDLAVDLGSTRKTWRTKKDTRVRPSHFAMEGQSVPLDRPFISGAGVRIWHPGDPMAPLSETIMCRCRLSYRLRRLEAA
jgi:hypothetical protein